MGRSEWSSLMSLAEICAAFKVGANTVKKWAKAGAPIVVRGQGRRKRYWADYRPLSEWRHANRD